MRIQKGFLCLVVGIFALLNLGCGRKARMNRMTAHIATVRAELSGILLGAGLPDAPSADKILSGGGRHDAHRPQPNGFQTTFEVSLGTLKGLVLHYSNCLGDPPPPGLDTAPKPLTLPGAEEEEIAVRTSLNPERIKALKRVLERLNRAIPEVAAYGPFDASSKTESLAKEGEKRPAKAQVSDQAALDRITALADRVRSTRNRAADTLRGAGLPEPPRDVDILTGGNWGAGIDLKQALESGFKPSCQVIYEATLGGLKGMVYHYSKCLGEPLPAIVSGEPGPLLPSRAESEQAQVRQSLTAPRIAALREVRSAFTQLLDETLHSGPFEAARASSELPLARNAESGTYLPPAVASRLLQADPGLDLQYAYTKRMLTRILRMHEAVEGLYRQENIPEGSPLRIPAMDWTVTLDGSRAAGMRSIQGDQLRKKDLVLGAIQKNLGALEASLLAVTGGDLRDCRYADSWQRYSDRVAWVSTLKAKGLEFEERSLLRKVYQLVHSANEHETQRILKGERQFND